MILNKKNNYNPGGPIGSPSELLFNNDISGPKRLHILVHLGGKFDGLPAKESRPWKSKISRAEALEQNIFFHITGTKLVWKPVIDPRTGKRFKYNGDIK